MSLKSNPLNEKQLKALNELVDNITVDQIIWLNGFLEGKLAGFNQGITNISAIEIESVIAQTNLTILYGTETGNSKELADTFAKKAVFKNISANFFSM